MENTSHIHTTQADAGQKTEAGAYRLNLSMTPQVKDELELLKRTTQRSSLVDVIRAAVATYKLIIEHQQAGGRVVLRKLGTDDETVRFV